jgi:hypothetical protein
VISFELSSTKAISTFDKDAFTRHCLVGEVMKGNV